MVSPAGRLGALEERQFRLLWLGQSLSGIGDALVPVALAFAVLELTGSAGDLGLVLATYTVAQVVFFLVGGVWSDRLPRRLVMLGCDIVRAAAQGLMAFVFLAGVAQLWHMIFVATLMGVASAFFGPASTGLVPQTVSSERLQQANALIGLSRNSIRLFGPGLSGVLVAAFGPGLVFAIDSVSFLLSGAFLVALRLPVLVRAPRQRFVRELAEGWREVRTRTWVWASLVCFSLSNIAVATYFVLGPLVVFSELGGARDWGIALMGGAAGGILGGGVAIRFRPRFPLRFAFPLILFCALQLLALVPPLPALGLAVAAMLAVASIAVANVMWNTLLQERIPEHALSRVSAYDWMVSLVFMPIGYAVAGPVATRIGVDTTLVIAAGLCAAANVGILAIPAVRNLSRLGAGPDERRKRVPAPAT